MYLMSTKKPKRSSWSGTHRQLVNCKKKPMRRLKTVKMRMAMKLNLVSNCIV
jgi:hypothetical protein